MAKKNAYYFSHDCNARLDEKMLAVRMKHGVEGYGVYFMLIERLAEATDHMSAKDYTAIAFDFRCGTDIIRSVIEDFGLFRFTEDGAQFYSESLLKRMAEVDELREKRRAAINTRWQREKGKKSIAENDTNVLQNEYKCNTNVSKNEYKGDTKCDFSDTKERKRKGVSKDTPNSSFSLRSKEESSDGKPPDAELSAQEKIDYSKLIEYWNEKTGGKWGKLVSIDNNRRKMVKARIATHGKAALVTAIDKAAISDFLAGATWFNFDWMIRPNNFDKIISGNYDNKHGTTATTTATDRREVTKPTGDYKADF